MGIITLIVLVIGALALIKLVFGAVGLTIGLILPILVWMLIGYLAGHVIRGAGYSLAGNVALGLGGGMVGSTVFHFLGLGAFDNVLVGYIIAGVVGAMLLIYAIRLLGKENFAR